MLSTLRLSNLSLSAMQLSRYIHCIEKIIKTGASPDYGASPFFKTNLSIRKTAIILDSPNLLLNRMSSYDNLLLKYYLK